MSRNRSPSEVNTRVIRVNLNDYLMLKELAIKHQETMADMLHQVLTFRLETQEEIIPPTQLYFTTSIIRSRVTKPPVTRQRIQHPRVERR